MIGERLRGLEEWRDDQLRWDDREKAKREAMETTMETFQDDLTMLKKAKNDLYSQVSILREDIGKMMERVSGVEFFSNR